MNVKGNANKQFRENAYQKFYHEKAACKISTKAFLDIRREGWKAFGNKNFANFERGENFDENKTCSNFTAN